MDMPVGWDKALVITTNDGTNLALPIRALYVGGAGDVTGVLLDGSTVLFSAVPVGAILPVQFKRINSTGTTATLLVGLAMI
jgi:hypothetical protein